jgi:hypothetical protein
MTYALPAISAIYSRNKERQQGVYVVCELFVMGRVIGERLI